jgi:DNA polymerase-3 subunit alpha
MEVQRTSRERDARLEPFALDLAARASCPIVATNDVRFLQRGDYRAHEARVCIHEGRLLSDKRRETRYSEEQYLKSPAEMHALFSDLPEALENAYHIAQRCNLEMEFERYHFPLFTPVVSTLRSTCGKPRTGLRDRLKKDHPLNISPVDYSDQLSLELA